VKNLKGWPPHRKIMRGFELRRLLIPRLNSSRCFEYPLIMEDSIVFALICRPKWAQTKEATTSCPRCGRRPKHTRKHIYGKVLLEKRRGNTKVRILPHWRHLLRSLFPVREHLTHKGRTAAPCNVDCRPCTRYKAGKCVGCPTTSHYRGTL
jgi:hypothetical protein